jgi:two-component system chemotaxis response regulator CheY
MVIASLRALTDTQCDQASTGLEAIERLALAPVDLIILDLNMPDMHGLEVLQFVRSHERYQAIPVIILTTRGDDDSRAATFAAGASQYLTKPFTPQLLAAQVSLLLQG